MSGKEDRYKMGGVEDDVDTESESDTTPSTEDTTPEEETPDEPSQQTAESQFDDLPHRLKYDSPKANRTEKTFVVGDGDQERLDELQSLAKREFSEKVYKTDVYLAAIRAGLSSSDDAFLVEMEEIGYGLVE